MTIVASNLYTVVVGETLLRRTGFPDIDYVRGAQPIAPTVDPVVTFGSTTATVTWTEVNDPTVTSHNVYVNTVKQGSLSAAARSASLINLTPSTPYTIQVTRTNSTAESLLSNTRTFTTGPAGAVPNPPTLNPTDTNVTTTGFTVSWTEAAGTTGLTGHFLYVNNVKRATTIGAGATSVAVTGLTNSTAYDINITSANASGESLKSNTRTFSTSTPPTGGSTMIGISIQDGFAGHGGQWDSVRIYTQGKLSGNTVESFIGTNRTGTCVGYTDGGLSRGASPSAVQTSVTAALNAFYNGAVNRDNVEFHIAIDNEIDATALGGAAAQTTLANAYERLSQVVNATSGGSRLWPMASVWIDLTTSHVQTGASDEFLSATSSSGLTVASFLRGGNNGMACSVYPAIQQLPYSTTSGPSGRSMEPYANYAKPVLDLAISYGITNVACWETGMNVDLDNPQHRPTYAEGQVWYVMQYAKDHGLVIKEWIYWNNHDGGQNNFSFDPAGTNPTTANKWFGAVGTFVAV